MHNTNSLQSCRLTLVATTIAHLRAELEAPDQLESLLGATVSSSWPTGEYDRDAMEFFLSRLEEGGKDVEGWYSWYALGSDTNNDSHSLVGAGGYFGPPGAEGIVEVGYSVLPEWQCRGYASEMVQLLVMHAFTFANVERVIAHTTASNPASIKVLLRCGFQAVGAGAEPDSLRFELAR